MSPESQWGTAKKTAQSGDMGWDPSSAPYKELRDHTRPHLSL